MTHAPSSPLRLESIDALRALTMLLMVWVNDFWSLLAIPDWLQHMPAEADALGFSDLIFPAFLVIVGLSIPFAIEARRRAGDATAAIQRHILGRSFALVVMGLFMVNLEYANPAAMPIPKWLWQIAMALAFVLVWNAYPKTPAWARYQKLLRPLGWATLAVLAYLYAGGTPESPAWMRLHWWGILGLIGLSYLLAATIALHARGSLPALAAAWLAFSLLNVAAFAGWLAPLERVRQHVWIITDGSLPALVMAGVLATTAYLRWQRAGQLPRFLPALLASGALLAAAGLALRPLWGISKIQSTPAWTHLCAGLTLLAFALLYWLVDRRQLRRWPALLGAAGTATLTCYLVPYFLYPIFQLTGLTLPDPIRTGALGLLKSLAFAFLVVWLAAALRQARIHLRL